MPLSLNEIKDRALAFSREWEGAKAERAEAQTFWNEFFQVFGMNRRRLASFEEPVKAARRRFEEKGNKGGFIDLFWRGTLIAEHKSLGKDLDSVYNLREMAAIALPDGRELAIPRTEDESMYGLRKWTC